PSAGLISLKSGKRVELGGHVPALYGAIAFSPDDKIVVAGGRASGTGPGGPERGIGAWGVAKTSPPPGKKLPRADINALAFSPIRRAILAATEAGEILELDATELVLKKSIAGHSDGVTSLAIGSSGQRVASVSWNAEAILWNAQGEKIVSFLANAQ